MADRYGYADDYDYEDRCYKGERVCRKKRVCWEDRYGEEKLQMEAQVLSGQHIVIKGLVRSSLKSWVAIDL